MKKEDINIRFIEAVDYLLQSDVNISKGDIANSLAITPQKFSEILNQRMNIGTDIAALLCSIYHISSNWLLTGSGEMIKRKEVVVTKHIVPSDSSAGIPLIPIEVVAGWNGIDSPGVVIADLDHYIIPEFIAAGAEYLIRVSGSSMYPKYSNGDILACRKIREITFFQWGKIYVIDSVQGAMVKRIFESKAADNIVCHSDNDKYPPFELPKSEIRSLSIVIGVVRLE